MTHDHQSAGGSLFYIDLEFLFERVRPTRLELLHGVADGWLDPDELHRYFEKGDLSGLAADVEPARALEGWLADPEYRHAERTWLNSRYPNTQGPRSLWLYLALAKVIAEHNEYEATKDQVASVWCCFDHPDEAIELVYWMPQRNPTIGGSPAAMMERWTSWLASRRTFYAERDVNGVQGQPPLLGASGGGAPTTGRAGG